jgi:hypothetical protein
MPPGVPVQFSPEQRRMFMYGPDETFAPDAVDMLAYPGGTGSPVTAPHRALQTVRENLGLPRALPQSRARSRPGLGAAQRRHRVHLAGLQTVIRQKPVLSGI